MQPTSTLTVVAVCLLALTAAVAVIVFWRHLARPGGLGLAARSLSQVGVIALSVLAVASLVNQRYAFYTTWSDLGGQLTGAAPIEGHQTRAGAVAHTPATGSADRKLDQTADRTYAALRQQTQTQMRLLANPGPTGQFVTVNVPGLGPAAGHGFRAGRVIVWLPPSYTDPKQANRTYPVIEAFHGVPGGPRDWRRVDHLEDILAAAISRHAIGEAIVVMPDYEPNGLDSECVNGGGLPMETWLTTDVPQWTISHLRVRATPKAWATMGYSAGGWCAATAGMLHPTRYSAEIVLGGYFRPEFTNWQPFPAGRTPARYDLESLAARNPPATNMWIQVALSDPTSGPQSSRFVKQVKSPLSVTTFTQRDVGHRVGVYMAVLPRALTWLGKVVPAFAG